MHFTLARLKFKARSGEFVSSNWLAIRYACVLELGAGATGIPGIVALKCGAKHVTFTDHPNNIKVLYFFFVRFRGFLLLFNFSGFFEILVRQNKFGNILMDFIKLCFEENLLSFASSLALRVIILELNLPVLFVFFFFLHD